ncbi:MAG: hypothetical protein ABI142_13145 [Bryocella sp.]
MAEVSSDRPFESNKIFTEEMANAARTRLKEWLAKQASQEDVLSAIPDDDGTLAVRSNELAGATIVCDTNVEDGEEGEDENEHPSIRDLFPFKLAERELIEQLGNTIRQRMTLTEPHTLRNVAAFLYALERLPYATQEVSLDLALMDRVDGNMSYVSVELDDQAFRLSTGGSVHSPGIGGDSYSQTTFEIELGGFREGTTQDFSDWLDAFVSGGAIELQGDGDADLSTLAPDDGWDRLAKYWETQFGDEGGW